MGTSTWRPFDRTGERSSPLTPGDLERMVHQAVGARRASGPARDAPIDALVQAWDADPTVPLHVGLLLLRAVADTLDAGWTTPDLVDITARRHRAPHAAVLEGVLAERAAHDRPPPSLGRWARDGKLTRRESLAVTADLLGTLWSLPRLPAPDLVEAEGDHDIDPKVLSRVRGLLAKAESTTYEEEAAALTAKATELMARHAIDRVRIEGAGGESPAARRVLIDDPYTTPKLQLLGAIAAAQRCRVVWTKAAPCAVATLFGFPDDLDTVEVLFTSLLVQATSSMLAAGAPPQPAERRSRGFRHAFLLAYASRVGQRLAEASARVVDQAAAGDAGGALLPVLAARRDAVDAAVDDACPRLARTRVTATDGAGWVAGGAAADRADLGGRRVAGAGQALSCP